MASDGWIQNDVSHFGIQKESVKWSLESPFAILRIKMDTLHIHDLKLPTCIGVHAWERQVQQTVLLTLELGIDVARAAATDDLADALNYDALCQRLITFSAESEFQLIETLAERLAMLCHTEFGVTFVKLTLHKPHAITRARMVGVSIERKF
jgi:7,8-dihydroneopterin aldolase/epimerase/oxygenase